MDENDLLSEIFETRYFGTTRCIVLYVLVPITSALYGTFVVGIEIIVIPVTSGIIKVAAFLLFRIIIILDIILSSVSGIFGGKKFQI